MHTDALVPLQIFDYFNSRQGLVCDKGTFSCSYLHLDRLFDNHTGFHWWSKDRILNKSHLNRESSEHFALQTQSSDLFSICKR